MDLGAILRSLDCLSQLYDSHWVCQAVVRCLPPLGQQYLQRLLFVDAIPRAVLDSWILPEHTGAHDAAIAALTNLELLSVSTGEGPPGSDLIALNPTVKARLRAAVTEEVPLQPDGVPEVVWEACPPPEALDAHAASQWEDMLLFLVGRAREGPRSQVKVPGCAPLELKRMLTAAGLVASRQSAAISEAGFRFLLLDHYSQLWTLLRQYLELARAQPSDDGGDQGQLPATVGTLLQLGFLQEPVSFDAMPAPAQRIAFHMAQLGLFVLYTAQHARWLCPTRLAASLASGGAAATGAAPSVGIGYIVTETNFRVYAYVTSEIQIAILQLFCRKDAVMPNLFVGTVTRESVTAALEQCGITSSQVIAYLQQQAHPSVASRTPIVPESVTDQIRLWEADTQRVHHVDCMLYDDFETRALFEATVMQAYRLEAHVWHDESAARLVCKATAHDELRAAIKAAKSKS